MHRRPLALLTVLVTLGTAAAVPLLDRWAPTSGPVVEAEHDPGRCPVQHDHRVCVQHQTSSAHPAPPVPDAPEASVGALHRVGAAATLPPRFAGTTALPRAPPLAPLG